MTFDEALETWNDLVINNRLTNQVRGVLNDLTDADLQMEIEELAGLIAFFNKYYEIFKDLRLAVVSEKPKDIVIPIYAQEKYPKFKIRAFSTTKAAIAWIKMG